MATSINFPTYGFINDTLALNEENWRKFFKPFIYDSVQSGLVTTKGTGMTVDISAGECRCGAVMGLLNSSITLDVSNGHSTYNRIDSVMVQYSYSDPSTLSIAIKQGTPSANPVAPEMSKVFSSLWQMEIAQILVPSGATSSSSLTITDKRVIYESIEDAIDDIVISSSTEPTSPMNEIWFQDEPDNEYTVPTNAEFTELEQDVTDLKNLIEDGYAGYKISKMEDWGWRTGRINSSGVPYIGDGYSKITSNFVDLSAFKEIVIYDENYLSSYGLTVYWYNTSDSSYISGVVIASANLPYALTVNPLYKYKFEWRNLSSAEANITGLVYKAENEIQYVPDTVKNYIKSNAAEIISKNLIDKNSVIVGEYVDASNGTIKQNVNFWRTDYLPITGGESYTLRYINQMAFFDKWKNFLYGVGGYSTDTSASSVTGTSPTTACYVIVCGHTSQLDTDQLEVGTAFTSYYPYKKTVIRDVLPSGTNISEILQYATSTVNITLIGDSITHGVGGTGFSDDGDIIIIKNGTWRRNPNGYCWANLLKAQLEFEFNCEITNNAIRGKGTDFYVENISTLIPSTSDIVICMLGTNNRMSPYHERMVSDLQTIYNYCYGIGAMLILVQPIPASLSNESTKDVHIEDICHMINAVATKNEIGCIDLYSQFYNYAWYRGIDFTTLLTDGLHPNDAGYYVIYRCIAESLGVNAMIEGATWPTSET